MSRTGRIALVLLVTACGSSSGQGLSLIHRAVEANTVRLLVENLTEEDAARMDPQEVCEGTPAINDMWFDALRLLGLHDALRSYARCADQVNVELIEATTLPLSVERQKRIAQYIDEWKQEPLEIDAVDEIFSTPLQRETPDWYTLNVLMALQADGTVEALTLCHRLGGKIDYRCNPQFLSGIRSFDTPEDAIAHDPFLSLSEPRRVATSRDGRRRIYILDHHPTVPHDDTCRPVAVVALTDLWRLERVECETGFGFHE